MRCRSNIEQIGREKVLAFPGQTLLLGPSQGLLAQLVERLNGIEEVISSNLIGSTNLKSSYGFTYDGFGSDDYPSEAGICRLRLLMQFEQIELTSR